MPDQGTPLAGRGVPAAPGRRSAADARPTQAHPLRVWGEPGGGGATAGTPPLLRHTVAGHVPRVPPTSAPDPRSLPCRSDDSGSRMRLTATFGVRPLPNWRYACGRLFGVREA